MALRLEHFQPSTESSDLFFRRVGTPAVDDFLTKGQIAGTQKYGTQAYFLRGGEWSTSGAPYRITADMSMLKPASNPLYGDLNINRYLSQKGLFPVGGALNGNYPRLTPNATPSFIDRINPVNRSGLRIDNPITGKTVYNRLLPVTQTPLSTTIKNIGVEANILLSQPEVSGLANKAGTFMNYAGIIPLATNELRRATSDYENPVTQEVYKKDEVQEVDGLKYSNADVATRAKYHPDNAENHPEITDDMRKKFNPKWFKE